MPFATKLKKLNWLLGLGLSISSSSFAAPFISEIHYDNSGTDINEAIEISALTTTDLSGWSLVLYNGSNGAQYSSTSLPSNTTLSEACGENGGTLVINYPSNGIQNGSPDGIALVNASEEVIEFIFYEGSLTASDGPAAGMTSEDIGERESSSTPVSSSLQLVDGVWAAPSASSFGVCTTPVEQDAPSASLSISEIHYDNSGADQEEAVEVTGAAGASINGWQIVLYNGNNGASYLTRNLSGNLSADGNCENGQHVEFISGIQNGSPDGIALVDPQGIVTEFISYEGSFTAVGGPADGITSVDIGVSESSSTPLGESLQNFDGTWVGPRTHTFGQCDSQLPGDEVVRIHDVQGETDSIAISTVVTVEAIVTADYQSSAQLSGFFIQEEDSDIDTNPLTSEGIFVFCSTCPVDVNVGDQVRVTGLANDFFGMSQLTATFAEDVEVLQIEQPLPSPAQLNLPISTNVSDINGAVNEINAAYEAMEGMLVQATAPLSVSEYFQLGRYGQVRLSANGRPHQFTDQFLPSEQGYIDHQIALAARQIILDDDNNAQNSALFNNHPIFHPQPGFSVDQFFRGGDTIENLTGVLHWSWAGFRNTEAWRIRPIVESYDYNFISHNPRTAEPEDVNGSLKIASFNVLNYFTTIDNGNPACGPQGTLDCRGANSPEELLRQTQKIVAAICAIDADIVGLMELENPQPSATQTPIASLVDAINAQCPDYAAIETGTIGTDAITVGIIFKPTSVSMEGIPAILDSADFTDPNNTGRDKNRPAVAASFKEITSERVLTIAVNHLKSKGSSCGVGDDDTTTGQANCNLTRTLAAERQAAWLASNPTGVYSDHVLIIGDLNAYRNEDPIQALIHAGYEDMVDTFGGPDAYGFVFNGQLGYLDHALASPSLVPFITGVTDWHINADEVNLLDYNDTIRDQGEASFEPKPASLPLFSEDPYRSSDHDPLVIGIQFPSTPLCHGKEATIYVDNGIIEGRSQNATAYTGMLQGTAGHDVIVGTAGADSIYGAGGNDVICAQAGNDLIYGESGYDILSGDGGNDLVFGGSEHDVLYGGTGNNQLFGGTGTDECWQGLMEECEK